MTAKNLIAKRLVSQRKKQGVSQKELSRLVTSAGTPLDRSAIAKIEVNLRQVRDFELVALAKALKTTPTYLLTSRNPKK